MSKNVAAGNCVLSPVFTAAGFVETSTCCKYNETILHLAFTRNLSWWTQMLSVSVTSSRADNSALPHLMNSWSDCRHSTRTSVVQPGHLYACSVLHQLPHTTGPEVMLLEPLNFRRCHWVVSVLHKLGGLVPSPGRSCQFACTVFF